MRSSVPDRISTVVDLGSPNWRTRCQWLAMAGSQLVGYCQNELCRIASLFTSIWEFRDNKDSERLAAHGPTQSQQSVSQSIANKELAAISIDSKQGASWRLTDICGNLDDTNFQRDHQSLRIDAELQLLQRTVTLSGGGAQAGSLRGLEADLRHQETMQRYTICTLLQAVYLHGQLVIDDGRHHLTHSQ
jgi:hypothetical protein